MSERDAPVGERGGAAFTELYLLTRDGAPAEPSVEGAYRETHLWVNVSAG